MAGSLIDLAIGFTLAQAVNPAVNFQGSVFAGFYGMIATAVFLITNAHLMLVAGVIESFRTLPVDAMPPMGDVARLVNGAMEPMLLSALQIAAPVLVTLFLTDVGFGILARIVPQLNPFAVQFGAKILVGLAAVMFSLAFAIDAIAARLESALASTGMLP